MPVIKVNEASNISEASLIIYTSKVNLIVYNNRFGPQIVNVSAPVIKTSFSIVKDTLNSFLEDGCLQMSAALAYYTVFALPGLLIIVIFIASIIFQTQSVEQEVVRQVQTLLGLETARTIHTVIDHVRQQASSITFTTAMGLGVLLFGATGAFAELQSTLNTIWGVKPDPRKGDVMHFLKKRVLSFGMILSMGFILLVSMVINTLLSLVGQQMGQILPTFFSRTLLEVVELFISFSIITLLFAAIFKVLPDAKIAWKDAGIGALFTSSLFAVGKELIGIYLGNGNLGSAYGAASSLAILLFWVYFSAVIIFLGAEFTQQWIRHAGRKIRPVEGAMLVDS